MLIFFMNHIVLNNFSPCGNRAVSPLLTTHICNKTVPCYLPITDDVNGSFSGGVIENCHHNCLKISTSLISPKYS